MASCSRVDGRPWQAVRVLIRPATDDDWSDIWPFWHRIAVAAETISWEPDTSTEDAEEYWLHSGGQVFVADDNGVIVGSAKVTPNYGPASLIANATYIVDPDRAGQGIGRQLVQHSLDYCRDAGYRGIVFNAVVETNVGAVHLYESLGFTIIGTVPEAFPHPTHGNVGLHIMHRKL